MLAGARWSRTTTILSGFQGLSSPNSMKALLTRKVFSWDITRSGSDSTTSPALTSSDPDVLASTFSANVLPATRRSNLHHRISK